MKKFLIWFLITIFPLVCGAIFMECVLRKIDNDYSYKNEWLMNNAHRVKTLNLGSSHGYYGINPRKLNEIAFNGAHVSQSLDYDYLILNKFIDKMDSLSVVILPISYFSMSSLLKFGLERFRIPNYVIEYGFHSDSWKDSWRLLSLPLKTNIIKIKRYVVNGKNDIVCDEYGWHWNSDKRYNKSDTQLSNGALRAENHLAKDLGNVMFNINASYVDKIVKLCSDRGVSVVLLTTPTWHTYRENIDKKQLSKMTLFCDSVAGAHSNVIYLNMFADNRFTSDDFFDSDHLCKERAMKLTEILNDTITVHYEKY